MLLVDMASHEILIFAFEQLLTNLLTDLQRSLRHNLTRLEADDNMLCKDCTFPRTAFSDVLKIVMCLFGFRAASVRDDESAVIGFVGIGNVLQCCKLISRDWKYLSGCQS